MCSHSYQLKSFLFINHVQALSAVERKFAERFYSCNIPTVDIISKFIEAVKIMVEKADVNYTILLLFNAIIGNVFLQCMIAINLCKISQ